MSGLLPTLAQHEVASKTVFSASQSFGVVALVLLVFLLIERDVLRIARANPARRKALSIAIVPLLVAVALTIWARVAIVIQ